MCFLVECEFHQYNTAVKLKKRPQMNSLKVYHRVTYFMYIRIILCFILVKLDENNNVYEPSNFHKMLCRGKDTMTIYSLLAIYSWVLIEGKYLRIFYTFDIDSGRFSYWCWLDDDLSKGWSDLNKKPYELHLQSLWKRL